MSMSDKEYYQLTISVSKALNTIETPIKNKHVRAIIISTYHNHGGHAFWAVAIRQPLQENRIAVWKFCHLLHKVLREGHQLCCQHSMRHRGMLSELGKLWGHLNDGYGLCIKHYTKLLITKLEFHDRNPRIPGSLALKREELDRIGENDINFYFQLAVEIFDYLDDIIALQATIFQSITTFCVNSMTSAGQCRLAPLIPLIQDSNPLYDFVVRIMFKLHANLPSDLLQGHRERFRTIFRQLKSFYDQARNLQYFVNLITVPKLPDTQPNFQVQSDFGNYTAPVVVMSNDTESEISEFQDVNDLVDTTVIPPIPELPSNHQNNHIQQSTPPAPDFDRLIMERDNLIQHLQMEIERLTKHIKMLTIEQRELQAKLEDEIAQLKSELTNTQAELMNLRIEKEELELRAQTAPTLEQRAQAEEERAKASEEKFQKLKTMYTQIRDEHVKLLRQHGEISKQLASSTTVASEASKAKEELKCQLDELIKKQSIVDEQLQQSHEKEILSQTLNNLTEEYNHLQTKYEDVQNNKQAEIAELTIKLEKLESELKSYQDESEKLLMDKNTLKEEIEMILVEKNQFQLKYQECLANIHELETKRVEYAKEEVNLQQSINERLHEKQELTQQFENLKSEHEQLQTNYNQLEHEINQQKHDFQKQIQEHTEQHDMTIAEFKDQLAIVSNQKQTLEQQNADKYNQLESLEVQVYQKVTEYNQLETALKATLDQKDQELQEMRINFDEMETKYQKANANMDRLLNEKCAIESDFQDLLHQQEELEEKHQISLEKIRNLENLLTESKIHGETALRTLYEACVKSSEKLTLRAINENDIPSSASGTPTYFLLIAEELQDVLTKLAIVHENYLQDNSKNVESLARKIIHSGHLLASVHVQGLAICNSSANIECGERIAEEIKQLGINITALFQSLHVSSEANTVKTNINELKEKLEKVSIMIGDLIHLNDGTEQLADLFENELAGMDKAIEEAASQIQEMLSKSRASDSGIKLEVNEKILDACTTLMHAIRVLVQKSRLLQNEIVSLGKGSASVKEFYKRNHQWTEGLISAAKSVAQGANFLVTAANKSVTGSSKHQLDLIVAAQEIAASTAQLVVASRVKAPRGSQHLGALGTASRNVTQATGAVVATAKDCSTRLEDSQDMDFSTLTVHQAKTKEMEVQVKVLELEQALQVERMRLAALRRKNYQSAD
uniref:Putative actin-binding protein n=1 Tax=Corethrella appendiculata TaxID=1370023 RepID=U5EQY1_9DIPT